MNSRSTPPIETDARITGRLRDLARVSRVVNEHLPDLAPWFGGAVDDFMTGKVAALDLALGVRGEGVRLPATQIALAERNHALVRAWLLFPGKPKESTTRRGERFINYLIHFEGYIMPLLASRGPRNALEAEALQACQAGKMPHSWRRCYDIIRASETN
ncbi:hypothetical protein JZU69_02230 [bacterium]|jgi:hypothetical protein|uniref:hypothetical protein n=1 Tax=Lamprocystis purpurea TaxID=61598 RepID=UPI00036AB530|nr:hypothetical protein [Lamprocystis purpurea]MBV5331233.1 hypothetical protein [bacterium]